MSMKKLGFSFYLYAVVAGCNLDSAFRAAQSGSLGWFIVDAALFCWMFFGAKRMWDARNEQQETE